MDGFNVESLANQPKGARLQNIFDIPTKCHVETVRLVRVAGFSWGDHLLLEVAVHSTRAHREAVAPGDASAHLRAIIERVHGLEVPDTSDGISYSVFQSRRI